MARHPSFTAIQWKAQHDSTVDCARSRDGASDCRRWVTQLFHHPVCSTG